MPEGVLYCLFLFRRAILEHTQSVILTSLDFAILIGINSDADGMLRSRILVNQQNYSLNVFTIRSGVDICFLQLILSLEDWEPERHAFDQRTIFLLLRVNLDLFVEGSCQFLLINLRHLLEDSTEFKNELDDLILCDLLTLDALVE